MRTPDDAPAMRRFVLIVDDDELSREVLSVLLDAAGYEVGTAGSGEEALTLMLAGPLPDVVLTDLQMPGLSGNALADELRSRGGGSVHLLAMSAGDPAPGQVDRYDGFLRKPFEAEAFERALQGREKLEVLPLASSGGVLDEAVYRKLVSTMGGEQVAEGYRFFLRDALQRVERLRVSVREGDDAGVRAEAHTLQGGCGMLGAVELRGRAVKLEVSGIAGRTILELDQCLEELLGACDRLRRMLEARWRGGE